MAVKACSESVTYGTHTAYSMRRVARSVVCSVVCAYHDQERRRIDREVGFDWDWCVVASARTAPRNTQNFTRP